MTRKKSVQSYFTLMFKVISKFHVTYSNNRTPASIHDLTQSRQVHLGADQCYWDKLFTLCSETLMVVKNRIFYA